MSGQALPSLAGAEWLVRPQTQRLLAALSAAGHQSRAVGGCVRNALMGLPVTDIDIATTMLPEQTMAVAKLAGMAAIPTGIEHGTVTVVVDHLPFEVTTLRRDVATDGRRAVVAFTQDWAEDAARRDFTMNALYCDADGTVFDPLGGYADLQARRVRFIGDADQRIREDYLRILRFFRFHATYGAGALDADGTLACTRARDGLRQLSAERVGAELMKLLAAERSFDAIMAMFDAGVLVDVIGTPPLLARWQKLITIDWLHDFKPDPALRLASLTIHAAEDAARMAERLRLSSEQRRVLTLAAIRTVHVTRDMSKTSARALSYRLGPADFRRYVLLNWAASNDAPSDDPWLGIWLVPVLDPPPAFPLSGRELLAIGFPAGPKVGEVLREMEAHWIASDFKADAEALKAMAMRHL